MIGTCVFGWSRPTQNSLRERSFRFQFILHVRLAFPLSSHFRPAWQKLLFEALSVPQLAAFYQENVGATGYSYGAVRSLAQVAPPSESR